MANIILFDSLTNLCKSIITTDSVDSIFIEENTFQLEVSDETLQNLLNQHGLLYVKNGDVLVTIPPSRFHKYDSNTETWVEDTFLKYQILSDEVRDLRLYYLQELDKIVSNPLRYASYSEEKKVNLNIYRQQLLDIPQQQGFPLNVTFPTIPQ
jgi:hypothetical protein